MAQRTAAPNISPLQPKTKAKKPKVAPQSVPLTPEQVLQAAEAGHSLVTYAADHGWLDAAHTLDPRRILHAWRDLQRQLHENLAEGVFAVSLAEPYLHRVHQHDFANDLQLLLQLTAYQTLLEVSLG